MKSSARTALISAVISTGLPRPLHHASLGTALLVRPQRAVHAVDLRPVPAPALLPQPVVRPPEDPAQFDSDEFIECGNDLGIGSAAFLNWTVMRRPR